MTAAEVRDELVKLEAERAMALGTALADVPAYMDELKDEIELCRRLYATAAVTELAILRAELSGAQIG